MREFNEKFRVDDYKIFETEHWIWSLRPVQATLGAGILSLKRDCTSFGDLNIEEFSDLNNIIGVIEKTSKKTFNYDVMNYLMLMMIDKQVHYHIIPRYERKIYDFEIKWIDSGWPGIPNLAAPEINEELLIGIAKRLKDNLIV